MGLTSYFSREKNEDLLYKKAAAGNKYKKYIGYISMGLLMIASTFLTFLSFGSILLIDGGITLSFLIIYFSLSIYDKLVNKYLKNLSAQKKRDFKTYLCTFYENILDPSINEIKTLINNFIRREEILRKTNEKFENNRNKFINESHLLKNKKNILVIGPTGSGKSTLINEFLNLNNRDNEGFGDTKTMFFKEYTSDDSKFCLIDSQGIDYSRPISEFSKIIQSKIKKCNESPYSFIDMIYYCTKDMNRFQTQEIKMINELKKLFNFEKIPLIIVLTQCYFKEDFIQMKNFIENKYSSEKFTVLSVLVRRKEQIPAYGLDELKIETENKLNNFKENSYASKFISNISQKLYKDYTTSFFSSFIKGFFVQNKNESIDTLFIKIFNMYRFKRKDLNLSTIYMDYITQIRGNIITYYENHLKILTDEIIDLHAESCVIEENKLHNEQELSEEYQNQKEIIKNSLKNNEYSTFKNDIDKIVFPCCLDVLKIELIKTFNETIFNFLKPKIEELMAHE